MRDFSHELRQGWKLEAVGRLAAGMAQDLNSIIMLILFRTRRIRRALSQLGAEHTLDEVDAIDEARCRAQRMLDQLLSFGRKQRFNPVSVDLNRLLERSSGSLKGTLGADVRLEFDLDSTLPRIFADAGHIERILVNLASNARDAMPHGGLLTIRTARIDLADEALEDLPNIEPGPYARLSVADTGTGIPPEVLPHIFEPFFTTKQNAIGAGLGLSVAFGLILQNGGEIEVESRVDSGTSLSIYLPLAGDEVATG